MSERTTFLRYVQLLLVFVSAWVGLFALPAAAQPARHLEPSLHVLSEQPAPGKTTRVAIQMVPENGWHGYWINPGDSGLSVEADWAVPPSVTVGPLEHPAPTLLRLAGLASYVHPGSFTLLADLKVDKSVTPDTPLPIKVALSWLVCSDTLCVPERANLEVQLVAGNGGLAAKSAAIVRAAEAALPRQGGAKATVKGGGGQWTFEIGGVGTLNPARARLYPEDNGWFDAGTAQRIERGANGALTFTVTASSERPSRRFAGVVSDGTRSYEVEIAKVTADPGETSAIRAAAVIGEDRAVPSAAPVAMTPVAAGAVLQKAFKDTPSLWIALAGAFVGGVLLNLMPCVFPILSLKALSLAKSGADQRSARVEGTAYFAGSVITTAALGGILVVARALGHDIGWSFQLQDPRIILLLMLLSLVIALNLAGLFELRGPTFTSTWLDSGGGSSAFGTGALAALIATPCSGPFMGVALGAALLLPTPAALLIFAGLGAGMALPFLLLAFAPQLQRRLPKPGTWMITFRRILAIPMLATALGLAWVLGRQSGVDGLSIGLVIATLTALGLWWIGLRQMRGVRVSYALAPLALAMVLAVSVDLAPASAAAVAAVDEREPFSEARLAELRATGTPVFVDFTADWCLICQVNEQVAIDRPQTSKAFMEAGVVVLEGDWTNGDPAITRFLAKHGRNSIPFYLYADRDGKMHELPQILSSDLLVEAAQGF